MGPPSPGPASAARSSGVGPKPLHRYLNSDDNAPTAYVKARLLHVLNTGCSSCHSGVNVGRHGYHPFGLIKELGPEILSERDKGRIQATETVTSEYVFRASPLRNIAFTAPYFHFGQVWDLSVAVKIMAESQMDESLKPKETASIVATLNGPTGPMPEFTLPVLPAETSATHRPTTKIEQFGTLFKICGRHVRPL